MTAEHPQHRTTSPVARWSNRLVNLLLVLTALVAVAWVLPGLLGFQRYVITGGSMSGSIEKGSVVFTESVPEAELAVGDVITYLPPADSGTTDLVTHRIIKIGTDRTGVPVYRTQGDANPDPDPWRFSLDAETQPVVRFHVPVAGHAFIALADRDTRMLVIGIPAGLVALGALRDLVLALRRKPDPARQPQQPTEPVPAAAVARGRSDELVAAR